MMEVEYEVWQGDLMVASTSGGFPAAYDEAMHYAHVYAQDEPVQVYVIRRELVAIVEK